MNNKIGNWSIRKTASTGVVLLTLLCVTSTEAADYYWAAGKTQSASSPLDWNDLGSWFSGGDSQSDPAATTLPGQKDTVYFRKKADDFVTFGTAASIELPDTVYLGRNASEPGVSVSFVGNPATVVTPHFFELSPYASISLLSGKWRWNTGSELYMNSPSSFKATGNGVEVGNVKIQAFGGGNVVEFSAGVAAGNVQVNLGTYNNADAVDNSLVIVGPGTAMGDFTLGGHYFNSSVSISGGVVFESFRFEKLNNGINFGEYTDFTNHFEASDVDFGRVYWESRPVANAAFMFGSNVKVPFDGEYIWVSGPSNILSFAGMGCYATNASFSVNGSGTRLSVTDGAFVESRRMSLGYGGASGVTARVSGHDTTWLVQPKDMEYEGAIVVGGKNDGRSSCGNSLVIDDGAHVNITTNLNYETKGNWQRLGGFLIGAEDGDDRNSVRIASGAVVTNYYWLCIGGGWMNNNGSGGSFNRLVVDGATLCSAARWYGADVVTDTTLYLGRFTGCSNSLEVVNGAYFKSVGALTACGDTAAGGSSIFVENSVAELGNRIILPKKNYDAGGLSITVGGTNGTIRTGCLLLDDGYSDLGNSGYDLTFRIPKKGRSVEVPMLDLTGDFYEGNGNKDAFWGVAANQNTSSCRLHFDINARWAHSGRGNSIILIAQGYEEGHYNDKGRYAEAGLNKLAELYAEDENLAGCTLSVSHDETNRRLLLRLTAGAQSGFAIFVR